MLEDKDLLSIQEVRTKVEKAFAAWQKYRTYSQEQVDAIVERMAAAARANAKRLADMAVEETGYGNAKDKYIKNLLNCDWLPRRMRGIKTVGILRELPDEKIVEIGVPMGVGGGLLAPPPPTPPPPPPPLTLHHPPPPCVQVHLRDGRRPLPGGARSRRARRHHSMRGPRHHGRHQRPDADRKSTRLNSSHA